MIFEAAGAAGRHLFTPEFRSVLWKSVGLTLLVLVGLWFGLQEFFSVFAFPWLEQFLPGLPGWTAWLSTATAIALALGLAVGLALLVGPVTAIIAGLFLDDVAEIIERKDYPGDPPGKALPLVRSMVLSAKFLCIVLVGNLLALLLLLIPGVNLIAFFMVNGYLLGREYFEFAAMRFRPEDEARELRSRHSGTVFAAGMIIAAFLAVPLLNLLTPLFAAGMMVHLHKAVSRKELRRQS